MSDPTADIRVGAIYERRTFNTNPFSNDSGIRLVRPLQVRVNPAGVPWVQYERLDQNGVRWSHFGLDAMEAKDFRNTYSLRLEHVTEGRYR